MNAWMVAAVPGSLARFMAEALAMEHEAARRYAELADVMEAHNNLEVAALLRSMENHERRHAQQIAARMGWPETPPRENAADPPPRAPEVIALEELHYLMQPWHALQLALAAEQRAEAFFAQAAREAANPEVREAALALQAEEAGHVALVERWLAQMPEPRPDWDQDPDPPRYTD